MSVSPGQRFGSYEIVAGIGAGGMGEVFRARDTNLKRDVALKLLPKAFLEDQDRLARFRREAEMLAALNHPNIAQVYGLERADGQTAIVMELVEGPTLADRIQAGPIPPDESLAIALQIVSALEAAHGKGIVHRDLKPANVKVREDGTVKVLDFGISKPIDPTLISGGTPVATTPAMTQTGIILGTAAYMSPEQARGKFVDERTDIWAFGCLLFEMLTGQPAFGGEDMMAVLARVIDRDTDLSSIPNAISPAVRHTIRLCLQKDPRKRIADIRDVRLALEGRFESELPRTIAERPSQPIWRRALAQVGMLAVGAALTALIGIALWPRPPEPRLSRWEHAVPAEIRPAFETGVPLLAVARDASEFAYASIAGIVRRPLGEVEGRLIQGTGSSDTLAPHYAADGRSIYYGVASGLDRGALKRIGTEGGTARQIVPTFPGNGWWPTADGALYGVLIDDYCLIVRIPPDGGVPETVFEDRGFVCFEPALLPGGRYFLTYGFALTDDGPTPHVLVHSIESQQSKELFEGMQPTLVDSRWLVYYELGIGLSVRDFDPQHAFREGAPPFGQPVMLVDDVLLVGRAVAHYRVSAGGEALVYIRRPSADIAAGALARLRPDGSLERLPFAAGNMGFPSVSPDGQRVALSRVDISAASDAPNIQLWLYDLLGEAEPRQLTFDGINDAPGWEPGGKDLVFSSNRSGGSERIWRQDADSRRPAEELTSPVAGSGHLYPVYAPDGRLFFTRRIGELDYDILIDSPSTGEPEVFRGGPGPQLGLDFSPDGKAFSYQSGSRLLVERYPPDGSSPLLVADVPTLTAWAVWSGDSRRLIYQSGFDEVTIVEIDTTALAVRARHPPLAVPLASGSVRMIDAFPESDDWLVVVDADSAGGEALSGVEIIVVLDWIDEIRRLVPPL